jgi:hypothetical protein
MLLMGAGAPAMPLEGLLPAGKTSFALGMAPADTAVQDTLRVFVVVTCIGCDSARVHLSPSNGLALVSGDTSFTTLANRALRVAHITVRALRSGHFEIRGTAEFGDRRDFAQFDEESLPIDVTGSTLRPGVQETRWAGQFRSGGRFRYAGWYLIPMDEDEDYDFVAFRRSGTPIRVLKRAAARCANCLEDSLPVSILVNRQGRVARFELGGQESGEPKRPIEVNTAVQEALASWRLEPAKINGKPVTDWMFVKVPISH